MRALLRVWSSRRWDGEGRGGSMCSVGLFPCPCLRGPESVAVGAGLDDVCVEGDAVDDGGDEARVGDDLAPLAERQVGRDGDAGLLFAFGEDLEQQLAAAGV